MSSLKQQAYYHIRQSITTGFFSAGDRLSPTALAKELKISHIPVREAISRLESEGIVERRSGRGAFVRQLKRHELIDLIEFRKVLECHVAAQAARRITDAELDELAVCLEGLRELCEPLRTLPIENLDRLTTEWTRLDLIFHMHLLSAAGNQCIIKALAEANTLTRMFAHRTDVPSDWHNPDYVLGNFKVHQDIFKAVRRRDAKQARRSMATHMDRARRHIIERFDWLHKAEATPNSKIPELSESFRRGVMDLERSSIEDPLRTMRMNIDKKGG